MLRTAPAWSCGGEGMRGSVEERLPTELQVPSLRPAAPLNTCSLIKKKSQQGEAGDTVWPAKLVSCQPKRSLIISSVWTTKPALSSMRRYTPAHFEIVISKSGSSFLGASSCDKSDNTNTYLIIVPWVLRNAIALPWIYAHLAVTHPEKSWCKSILSFWHFAFIPAKRFWWAPPTGRLPGDFADGLLTEGLDCWAVMQ